MSNAQLLHKSVLLMLPFQTVFSLKGQAGSDSNVSCLAHFAIGCQCALQVKGCMIIEI